MSGIAILMTYLIVFTAIASWFIYKKKTCKRELGIHTVNIPKKGQFLRQSCVFYSEHAPVCWRRLTCPFSELTAEITIFR